MTWMQEIAALEAAALKAWPAFEQVSIDGYVARFAEGYTKRANSVNRIASPFPSPFPSPEGLIPACEALYRERGLPAIFRLIDCEESSALDGLLAQCGYEVRDPTAVMIAPAADVAGDDPPGDGLVRLELDAWLDVYVQLSQASPQTKPAHRRILQSIPAPRLFAAILVDGVPVACGMGVLDRERFGLFDIVTHPAQRRQGFGSHLVRQMAGWAQGRGAMSCYLQVVRGNAPALAMYSHLGFTEAYGYWYRIQVPK